MKRSNIAHFRKLDSQEQSVQEHLEEVAEICGRLTAKLKLGNSAIGNLLGLLHDLGKYSNQFQTYIQSATGLLNPDIDMDFVDATAMKGKIDHSTAGAQWIWQQFARYGLQGELVGQILAICLASHHGGMLDCLKPDGEDGFQSRINKADSKTHLIECLELADTEVLVKLEELVTKDFLFDFCKILKEIVNSQNNESELQMSFKLGFFSRFLFSCLIDADRIDSADFENPGNAKYRTTAPVDWQLAIDRLEEKLADFQVRNKVDIIRCEISDQCKKRADDDQGIYTLTVPTGGGKTYTSIRYALHHARKHQLDHIIYIIPYTSIIEQNAEVIRDVLEKEGDKSPWVLEHHSNLEPEEQTWQSKIVADNWDSPIIFTTMVQFLEVLFGGGTRGARRMHTIANSVLVFDEIQSLPINCVHLFCNALQFFVDHTRTTAVLCTATQPLLDNLKSPDKGQLNIPKGNELVKNMTCVFDQFKRVELVVDRDRLATGWSESEICNLAVTQMAEKGNCLVIVNTKKWALSLYESCLAEVDDESLFHLSTSLCPAHRQEVLAKVRNRLDEGLPVLCISTQLIEAGVDVDFNAVIRFLAGLDSIAQAAGRCNRNGNFPTSQVFVVNPKEESIDMLKDIKIGREKSLRIFSEYEDDELLNPEVMTQYFSYYFYERADLMTYYLTAKQAEREDTLLNLLSNNVRNVGRDRKNIASLQQSFKTAGKAFKAIDAPTQAVIVKYGKGKEIVAELCGEFEPAKAYKLLKQAQKYSVNVFPNVWQKLIDAEAVFQIQGEEIYFLDERHYSEDFGLSVEVVSQMDTHIEGGV